MANEWDAFQLADAQPEGWDQFKLAESRSAPGTSVADVAMDVAKGLGSGVVRGAAYVLGQAGDINKAGQSFLDKMKAEGVPVEQNRQNMLAALPEAWARYQRNPGPALGSAEFMRMADTATGLPITSYEPQSFAGKAARTVGEFIPAAALTRAGFLGGALAPGVASETAGALTEGTRAEPWARLGGAVAGGFVPSAVSRLVTPFPASPAKQQAVASLQNEGVDALTAGQRVGNKGLQYLEDTRGGAVAQDMAQRQGEQFTSAALRRAGINAPRATPEVIDDAFARLGQEFDYLASRNVARFDRALASELGQAARGYNNLVSAPNRVPAVDNFVTEIANVSIQGGGNISGSAYQSLRSRMEDAARAMRFTNNEAATAIREMREALDDAMERSLRRAGRIDDLQSWRQARREYRNLLPIERAAAAAGENAASGILSPQQLRTQITNTQAGKRDYARGRGDFAELVRSANVAMPQLPNSGTAQRNLAQNLGAGIPAILGGYGGSQAGGTEGAAAGALAGLLAPRLAGRVMMSRPGQAYLSNQVLAQPLQNSNAAGNLYRALMTLPPQ